jgi:hypothetical protein
MSRQSFLSSDFFVTASEEEAKKALCLLPQHLPHITLLKENTLLHTMRFLYEHPEGPVQYYVDVSILPLNDQCICFSLHCSYTNGHSFHSDPDISNALYNFEQSVHAALKNDFSSLLVEKKTKPASKKTAYFTNTFLSLLISKYHY